MTEVSWGRYWWTETLRSKWWIPESSWYRQVRRSRIIKSDGSLWKLGKSIVKLDDGVEGGLRR